MKRFHVHVSVKDLVESVRFYSTLFAAEPSVLKDDYAKLDVGRSSCEFCYQHAQPKPSVWIIWVCRLKTRLN